MTTRDGAKDDYFRARRAWETGDLSTARGLYETAIAESPDFPLPHFDLAQLLSRIDPSKAMSHLQRFMELAGDDPAYSDLMTRARALSQELGATQTQLPEHLLHPKVPEAAPNPNVPASSSGPAPKPIASPPPPPHQSPSRPTSTPRPPQPRPTASAPQVSASPVRPRSRAAGFFVKLAIAGAGVLTGLGLLANSDPYAEAEPVYITAGVGAVVGWLLARFAWRRSTGLALVVLVVSWAAVVGLLITL